MSRNAVAFVNIHPQKSKWVTAKIILVSLASILVGEWLQRQRHIEARPLYILFKCDVRHRLHCFVCTDTHLFNFTKGKTDLVNQRWRRTTCLKHQCYDVGCYPCLLSFEMSNCEVVTFPLVSWVRCGAWLYRFLIFSFFLSIFLLWHYSPYSLTFVYLILTFDFKVKHYIRNRQLLCNLWTTSIENCITWLFAYCKGGASGMRN